MKMTVTVENLWEQSLTWSMLSPNCVTHEPDMACVGDCFLLFIILLNPVDKDLACISRQEHPLSVPHFLLTVCESKRHKLQITSQQINIYFKVSKTWFALRVDFQCCVIFTCIKLNLSLIFLVKLTALFILLLFYLCD